MLRGFIQQAFDWVTGSQALPNQPRERIIVPKKPTLDRRQIAPQDQRHIVLQGQPIAYQFERSKRRTIGFIVGNHGLLVRAPRWTTIAEVESAIQEKSHWIVKKLHEVHERQIHSVKAAIVWADGASLDYLGQPLQLQLGAMLTTIDPDQGRLWIALPPSASEAQIQDAAQSAIQRAALLLFETRLNHYAPLLGVHWTALKLTHARGRWGSAKSDGTIRLNWRLMHYRLPVIDYVVVHELSHLRHMNHSPRFWDTVESILPDYAKLKKELRPR
ncbi:MAG: SprT family zinc-dependent metalloprotease [Cytophagales bacterium]|nr:SprT family zinc-dependent metalloprotease [Cytophagales bacterium]